MNGGFTKLYYNIILSSIWTESHATRIVWVTFLAMADVSGNVIGVSKRLSASANVSIEEYDAAIEVLSAPDTESKSQEHEGRRIVKIPGGWHIVNYAKYRSYRDPVKRMEQNRESQQRCRDKKKRQPSVSQRQPMSAQEEEEAEAEANIYPPTPQGVNGFEEFWKCYPRKKKKADAQKAWKQLKPDKALREKILVAVEQQKQSEQWLRDGGQFIPYPASWLRGGSWDDEPPEVLKSEDGQKLRELPQLFGKYCSNSGCGMPARYKTCGSYGDNYYCIDHIAPKTKERLRGQGYNV